MFARSTTVMSQPGMIDKGIEHVRDVVMSQVRDLDGFVGLSLIADRTSGRCIVTTAWESEDAMRASADAVKPMRAKAAEIFGGEMTVDEWEVAYMHRDHRSGEGACARVTWSESDLEKVDQVIDTFKSTIIPKVEDLEGFCSVSLLVDRASGRACATVTYDSAESLAATRDAAMGLRADLSTDSGLRITEVAEFELVLAHLDVPELV